MIKPLTAREASLENPMYPEHRIGVCVGVNMYDAVKKPVPNYRGDYNNFYPNLASCLDDCYNFSEILLKYEFKHEDISIHHGPS